MTRGAWFVVEHLGRLEERAVPVVDLTAVNGAVEFDASDGFSEGLFRSDGTPAGTIELAMNMSSETPLGVTATPDGDFNGDSFSDILFQNASTGQASIWEMYGTQRIGVSLSANSGPIGERST